MSNQDLRKQFSLWKMLDFEFLSSQNKEIMVFFNGRSYQKGYRQSKSSL